MLDLIANGSSWEEIVDLALRIEDAGATIINTGLSPLYLPPSDIMLAIDYLIHLQALVGMKLVFQQLQHLFPEVPSVG
jgi:hypothetical protein